MNLPIQGNNPIFDRTSIIDTLEILKSKMSLEIAKQELQEDWKKLQILDSRYSTNVEKINSELLTRYKL